MGPLSMAPFVLVVDLELVVAFGGAESVAVVADGVDVFGVVDGVSSDGAAGVAFGVLGAGAAAAAAETVTASFMPAEQWPGVPHMKYRVPALESVILVF